MARRHYLILDGRKVYGPDAAAVKRAAQRIANRIRRGVTIGYDEIKAAAAGRKRRYRRNPLMGGHDFTGELWKISFNGPHGTRGAAYAISKSDADNEVRVLRARGWRPTHVVRLRAPNLSATRKRRSTARK